MIVLQVMQSWYPATVYGGPVFSIHYACQALARAGCDVRVATTNANGGGRLDVPVAAPVTMEANYRVSYYRDTVINRFSWGFTLRLPADMRPAEIVHLQDVFSLHAAWAILLAWLLGKPMLLSPRGVFSAWAMAARRNLAKRLWLTLLVMPFTRDTRRVWFHATSPDEERDTRALFPRHTVVLVPNGMDCAAFDAVEPMRRSEYLQRFFPKSAVAGRAKVLCAMGRLHPVKGFDIAIRTLAREELAGSVLLIAGGDEGERAALEALAESLGVSNRVAFTGALGEAEKIAFLKGADLFLFPSHTENFGLACLEALAAGLPVVASRRTPWERVQAEGAGLWVENTPEDFALAAAQSLAGDARPRREAARALASQYGLPSLARKLMTAYTELAHANG